MKIGVVIPSLNEANALGKLLSSIEVQLTDDMDVLVVVVDGHSADNSKIMFKEFSSRSEKFHFLLNEKKITPVALNIGTKFCLERGADVVQYFGAHSTIHKDYLKNLIKLLRDHEDIAIFSPSVDFTEPRTKFELLNQHFTVSRFGRNWNKIYRMTKPVNGFTTGIMAVRKIVFEKIGFYNEAMVRNQDVEFALHAVDEKFKILTHPDLLYYYTVRDSFSSFSKQMFTTGIYVALKPKLHKLKHRIPGYFWGGIIGVSLLELMLWYWNVSIFLYSNFLIVKSILSIYSFILLFEWIKISIRFRSIRPMLIIIYFTTHFLYASGFFKGLFKRIFGK